MGKFKKSFKDVVIQKLWPWFIKYAWPIVKKYVLAILQGKARKKAEEAEDKAKSATDKSEANKYRTTAKVWREVAEQFLGGSEELKQSFDEIQSEAYQQIKKLDVDIPLLLPDPSIKITQGMKIQATMNDVSALWIHEENREEDEGSKIIIETMRDFESLEETGREEVSHIVEIEGGSFISFEGLLIESTAWLSGGMTIYFPEPIDIAIVNTGNTIEVPFDPEADPITEIVVTDLDNVTPPLHTDS